MSGRPLISAVLCTYNRRALLLDAIETLVHQDIPTSDYEILVIDNNSTDGTSDAVRERFSGVTNLSLLVEREQGIAFARNTGARACRSPIVAFTDDDALAPRDWLRRFVERYDRLDPKTALIGGEIKPLFEEPRPDWLSDALLRPLSCGLMWGGGPHYLREGEWLCEVNSAYRLKPFLEHGCFPEDLGRVGGNLMSGENIVNEVLRHAGYLLYYDPENVVRHRVPPSRTTRTWFRRRMFWQGVSGFVVREYLKRRGIESKQHRPLDVPCAPADWVKLFDEQLEGQAFRAALDSAYDMGYLLASQQLIAGR
jgi:glycosyltransferase involved in cell wall biosynthesis